MIVVALLLVALAVTVIVRSLLIVLHSTPEQRAADRAAYRAFKKSLRGRGMSGKQRRIARTAWLREHMSVAAYRRRKALV